MPNDGPADAHRRSTLFDGTAKTSLILIDDSFTHITGDLSEADQPYLT
jgi:hypothetical protein